VSIWEREHRRLWHDVPSAFWLRPTPDEVLAMLSPYMRRPDAIGDAARRIAPVLTASTAEVPADLAARLDDLIASVSRTLEALEKGASTATIRDRLIAQAERENWI
jgi:hypothetical protein